MMTEILDLLWAYVLVFILAAVPFIELFFVIPLAMAGGLATVPVTVIAFLGNLTTVFLVILFVDKIKGWRRKRKGIPEGEVQEEESKKSIRAKKLWQKYGLPGLAVIGTGLFFSHLTAFLIVSFGGAKRATMLWMTISLIIWAVIMAVVAHFGLDFFNLRTDGEGFLHRIFLNN